MDVNQINDALNHKFQEKDARIVFWNDPEQEFDTSLPHLEINDVAIINLDEVGALETKIRIEREEPDHKFLLYSPEEEPEYGEDWLLDVRLYSDSFRADRASILLNELGLAHHTLRQHLSLRRKFFDSKERLRKLKQLVEPNDTELDLDRKMLAVVTRANQPELFNIVRTIFHSMTEDEVDLEVEPAIWGQIEKFDLDEPFWQMAHSRFGYSEETPKLKNLLIQMLVSDFAHQLECDLPNALLNQLLPRSGTSNAVVCLDQWRDSGSKGSSYDLLSEEVSAIAHIGDHLHGIEIERLLGVVTFLEVEKAIIKGLLSRISSTSDHVDVENIREIVTRRQDGHWVSSSSVPEEKRKGRYAVYEAIAVAAEFWNLRNHYQSGFDYDSEQEMYHAYEKELYKFDQLYRHFCEKADIAESQGWHVLKTLRDEIEDCYNNWYLTKICLSWGKYVDGLIDNWQISDIPNQYKFYDRNVSSRIGEAENRKAFVIISDAFRYEVAQELTGVLNGKYRFEASLSSQLSVLPSYTALGMASLLPHKTLEYNDKGDVLVDGKPTSSLEYRNNILSQVEGAVIKAENLLSMKQNEGRDFAAKHKVIYIYHDEIDSRGEKASTEDDTFEAARKTVSDLGNLVKYVVNSLNGNYVVVTADHGFLFSESAPDETDKSKLLEKPEGTVKPKKRYLLGHDLPDEEQAWHGKTSVTAKAEGGMEFWIPKGTNRFHFAGGAKFIHGGAMLQEVVVPIITVKQLKSQKQRGKTKVKFVTVQVIGQTHKITTQSHRFKLMQMDTVSDRVKPITLKVAIQEGDELITNSEKVTFDSTSTDLAEREKSVFLTLQDRPYNKNTQYRLVLQDADTGIEQQSVDVIIDRAIADDFDF